LKQGNVLADVSLIYSGNKKLNKSRYKSELHGDKTQSGNVTMTNLYYWKEYGRISKFIS